MMHSSGRLTPVFAARFFLMMGILLLPSVPSFAQTRTPADSSAATRINLPIDVRVKKVILRYRSEVSFLMPEGEVHATFERRFGHFSSMIMANYNYVRGEMQFRTENVFTRYRLVPQLVVYDKLDFVPLFDRDSIWRREQAVQIGGRLLFPLPLNTYTSFNYVRYSTPSRRVLQAIESERAFTLAQSFGGEIDSVHALGFIHSGLLEAVIDKAFRIGGSPFEYTQLRLLARGQAVSARLQVDARLEWKTLLRGDRAPVSFLGGRNRISGFATNSISGVNLLYGGLHMAVGLSRKQADLGRGVTLRGFDTVIHIEAGQAGDRTAMSSFRSYAASAGLGFNLLTGLGKAGELQLFAMAYRPLLRHAAFRYFAGIQF